MSQETKQEFQLRAELEPEFKEILTEDALSFVEGICRSFEVRRQALLKRRQIRQQEIDNGVLPTFLESTKHIREADWKIAPLPKDLQDRRVEITGPVERKMVINALNSGAHVFMADFEDANAPTWRNTIQGQVNLRDAIRRTITFKNEKNGKTYQLNEKTATLVVRPRGWHLEEKNITLHGQPVSASLVDFGLYMYHNAEELRKRGTGPYFYLPKMESHLEARLWNDVFVYAQKELGIPKGTIKATVLIETILASFEMDEILFELKDHSAGLNCGRWDYIFSYLKRFRNHPDVILPDRAQVTMTSPFMRAYSLLTIKTCHRRGAPAIGGMAAQIPVKGDEQKNAEAFEKVRLDKEREARDGHDGTWVAHPALVPVAKEVFNQYMPTPNQIDKKREDVEVSAKDLIEVPNGSITEEGLRMNISVGIQYIASWLNGNGAAPINHLMEDAATAEISRAQVWQWIRHPKGVLTDGRKITRELVDRIQEEEMFTMRFDLGEERFTTGKFAEASELFTTLIEEDEFVEFLTLPGYQLLN
ncbi:malate synthase [Halalkalibacter wakoensis JCM 9140]|uniref:Malate synthase n=1 Tax=Halalkalibacter wakoensis JCM 9140 TaxID=1236970 RepID=W4PXW6_9BACI|nr:malate synthase A [Halalkalibacter wakoensis]GAE24696.1 malate synthase [Halalkalibacter wakoensis JCM 9140]